MSESQLPKFLNARHIKNILQISYSEASRILEENFLPVITIGKTRRVLNNDFLRWLESNKKGVM